MWHDGGAGHPEAPWLRASLLAAQRGARREYIEVLEWAASRARARFGAQDRGEEAVQAALRLLHEVRHTYHPGSCPLRWVDAVLVAVEAGQGRATTPARAPRRPAWSW